MTKFLMDRKKDALKLSLLLIERFCSLHLESRFTVLKRYWADGLLYRDWKYRTYYLGKRLIIKTIPLLLVMFH